MNQDLRTFEHVDTTEDAHYHWCPNCTWLWRHADDSCLGPRKRWPSVQKADTDLMVWSCPSCSDN